MLYFLRASGNANTAKRFGGLLLKLVVVVPTVEYCAQTQRDKYYWPIVRKVYLELKKAEEDIKATPFIMVDMTKIKDAVNIQKQIADN